MHEQEIARTSEAALTSGIECHGAENPDPQHNRDERDGGDSSVGYPPERRGVEERSRSGEGSRSRTSQQRHREQERSATVRKWQLGEKDRCPGGRHEQARQPVGTAEADTDPGNPQPQAG